MIFSSFFLFSSSLLTQSFSMRRLHFELRFETQLIFNFIPFRSCAKSKSSISHNSYVLQMSLQVVAVDVDAHHTQHHIHLIFVVMKRIRLHCIVLTGACVRVTSINWMEIEESKMGLIEMSVFVMNWTHLLFAVSAIASWIASTIVYVRCTHKIDTIIKSSE